MFEFYLELYPNLRNNRVLCVKEGESKTKVLMEADVRNGVEYVFFSRKLIGRKRLQLCKVT